MRKETTFGMCERCKKNLITYELIEGMQIGKDGVLNLENKVSRNLCLNCIKEVSDSIKEKEHVVNACSFY